MFPEESTDVHISSASLSSSLPLSLSSTIKFNPISPIQSPSSSTSTPLISSQKFIKEKQIKQNILAITAQESAQAVIVIDIPILSAKTTATTTKTTTLQQQNIETAIRSSFATISLSAATSESASSLSSSEETSITIDRIDHRNENEKLFKKFNSTDHYKCIPPPLFVILVSIIEIAVFLYESWILKHSENYNNEDGIPIPSDSILVYRPDRRQEVWRFFSYMVLHANWFHLGFNVIVQLIFGIPLEITHGSIRIGCIYLAGVFAGSLGTSVVDSKVYLVGASGGVYALLGSHLANILLNYKQIKYVAIKLLSIFIFGLCDIGFAIYTHYFENNDDFIVNVSYGIGNDNTSSGGGANDNDSNSMPPISYAAHLSGTLAGITIGLLVLKNFKLIKNENNKENKSHRHLLWWSALGIYMAFIIFTITFNIMNTMTAQILEEKGQVIKQYLFHNLGSS